MPTTFLHMADVHLGYQQYQSEERLKDFSRVFRQAIENAIARQVDFVLIAGDLFHKASINPTTLLQAKVPLDNLRQAGIPVIAITGNHDATRYGQRFSWLDYLVADGCLTLLKPGFTANGQLDLTPGNGGYIDLHGVRVIGLNYLGASTSSILTDLPESLAALPKDVDFTVLMAHFGLEGEVPNLNGAISHSTLAPLKPHINYLALGHVHKPVVRDGWIYNPGSLEACGMDERIWAGGWYHVTVNGNGHTADHYKSERRPLHRLKIEVDGFGTPTALYDAVRAELTAHWPAMKFSGMAPVVQVWLEGVLAFDRHDLDTRFIETMIDEIVQPLKALVRNNTRATEYEVKLDERLDRTGLEQQVLTELIIRDERYRPQAAQWAQLMVEIKKMVLQESEPADIADAISRRMVALAEAETGEAPAALKTKLAQLKAELEAQDVD
ncbi:MAG: 3',5'-cyclic adenosine monophosphate phosphodiesterase CpdA [Anaerolineae bacterium]|nr:3',5'-cyclic adenosine monophosphate phosphodiesterase CpdA [Anaerolineae bacterium]